MVFLRGFGGGEDGRRLFADGVWLRAPQPGDFPEWSGLREQSRSFLQPWEPLWPRDELTRGAFRRRLRRHAREMREDRSFPFFIFRSGDDRLLGGATLSNIRRGVAQTCSLGYWMGEPYAGQGYMSRAVTALLAFAYSDLNLHRVEAACLPHNGPSIRLLQKAGFEREGYARGYLRIAGEWQDHLLFAKLAGDPEASGTRLEEPAELDASICSAATMTWRGQKETL